MVREVRIREARARTSGCDFRYVCTGAHTYAYTPTKITDTNSYKDHGYKHVHAYKPRG
jgi:hypothetical protein